MSKYIKNKIDMIKEYKRILILLYKEWHLKKKFPKNIETNALLLCHALEKGMGVNNVKTGYGKEKVVALMEALYLLQERNMQDTYVYKESVAVLYAYFSFQKKNGVDVSCLEKEFLELNTHISQKYDAGIKIVSKAELLNGLNGNFQELVDTRHSMRRCSGEEITESEFLEAIKCAIKAPSACNRQPCKVYYALDTEKNKALSMLVPGNRAFANDIRYYCVVTADRAYFGGEELFQWYVNGGIFVAYLTLAMHSVGIGSCVFQWPDFYKTENELRKLIGCKESEAIVSVIGFGKYPEELKCICAQRKEFGETVVKF